MAVADGEDYEGSIARYLRSLKGRGERIRECEKHFTATAFETFNAKVEQVGDI